MHDAAPADQSLLTWAIHSLGSTYIVLLPLSALVSFVFILLLLFRGKGPMAAASILLFVFAPLMIGVYAAVQGMINSYSVIASGPMAPKPAEIAVGVSTALFAPVVSMLLMVPSYIAAAIGTLVRYVSSNHTSGNA